MIVDHSLRWIVPFVIAMHLMSVIFFNALSSESLPLPSKKLAVKTVKLSPPKPEVKKFSKEEKPAVLVKKESKPDPKPVKEVKKTPAPKVAPVSKSKENEKKSELVARAKEKINKIESSSKKLHKSSLEGINTPQSIEHLQSELSFREKELAYRDELSERLKRYLKLPEYGDVKIQLEVERSGKIAHFKILSFQSALNAEYIEKNLPKVSLPDFKDAESYNFTIVMSNE